MHNKSSLQEAFLNLPISWQRFFLSSYQQSPSHHILLMVSLLLCACWHKEHLGARAKLLLTTPQLNVSANEIYNYNILLDSCLIIKL